MLLSYHQQHAELFTCVFVTHLIIIIISEVLIFPNVVIFSVVVCSRWLYHHNLTVATYRPIDPGMMTSSNGNIICVSGLLCGKFTGDRWIPRTKATDEELWCFFDLRLNRRLSKQCRHWWFETLLRSLWRRCDESWLFSRDAHSIMCANNWIHFGLKVIFVCLHITWSHLPPLCKLIWKHWTCKMFSMYIRSSLSINTSIFSVIFHSIYGTECLSGYAYSSSDCENVLHLIITITSPEIWIISQCLGLDPEAIVCAICLSMFLYLVHYYNTLHPSLTWKRFL